MPMKPHSDMKVILSCTWNIFAVNMQNYIYTEYTDTFQTRTFNSAKLPSAILHSKIYAVSKSCHSFEKKNKKSEDQDMTICYDSATIYRSVPELHFYSGTNQDSCCNPFIVMHSTEYAGGGEDSSSFHGHTLRLLLQL